MSPPQLVRLRPYDPTAVTDLSGYIQRSALPFKIASDPAYGSIGTDVDSAIAINNAIEDAAGSGRGGTVLLPAGVFDYYTRIVPRRWVSLKGMGPLATSLRARAAVKAIQLDTTGDEFDSIFEDFQIDFNGIGTYGIDGIDANGAGKNKWRANRLRMINMPASSVGVRTGAWSVALEKLDINGTVGAAGIIGIDANNSSVSGSNALRIRDCSINYTSVAAVRVTGSNGSPITTGVAIEDNTFDGNAAVIVVSLGTPVTGWNVRIVGNRCESNTGFCVDVSGDVQHVKIKENEFVGTVAYLVRVGSPDAHITDNYFGGMTTAAIRLVANARRTVTDKNVRSTFAVPLVQDDNASEPHYQLELQQSGLISARRYISSEATTHAVGDYLLSAGWGSTASISALSATDGRGRITVSSSGSGQSANPTITLTFKDGAWSSTPIPTATRGGGSQLSVHPSVTTTTTTMTITFPGTPVAGETYTFNFQVEG